MATKDLAGVGGAVLARGDVKGSSLADRSAVNFEALGSIAIFIRSIIVHMFPSRKEFLRLRGTFHQKENAADHLDPGLQDQPKQLN